MTLDAFVAEDARTGGVAMKAVLQLLARLKVPSGGIRPGGAGRSKLVTVTLALARLVLLLPRAGGRAHAWLDCPYGGGIDEEVDKEGQGDNEEDRHHGRTLH